ncbi:hypothetical protein TGMAS_271033 [Toxoplasma gondii MAS]|uniref:Secreted protein n=1 Tax=Toxoplasma gondii MAS TaxID=943118 RepID=A0A086QVH0_TOXGO|nr:hypothetical protein TGMAS_271033 [Toxoplasma gondii MAS]
MRGSRQGSFSVAFLRLSTFLATSSTGWDRLTLVRKAAKERCARFLLHEFSRLTFRHSLRLGGMRKARAIWDLQPTDGTGEQELCLWSLVSLGLKRQRPVFA